jgi:hypothetical protein
MIEGLQHHAKALETRAVELTKFADVVKPLYDSLDEGQKYRLIVILHVIGEHHAPHFGGGEGPGWGGPEHKG